MSSKFSVLISANLLLSDRMDCKSSIKNIYPPFLTASAIIALNFASKLPLRTEPATRLIKSSLISFLFLKGFGTFPLTNKFAICDTVAVLPIPESPTITTLLRSRFDNMLKILLIVSSLPITSSILPFDAIWFISTNNSSTAPFGVCSLIVALTGFLLSDGGKTEFRLANNWLYVIPICLNCLEIPSLSLKMESNI